MDNFNFDKIKKFFPFTDKATDTNGLITSLIVYVVVAAVVCAVFGILSIPFLSWLVCTVAGLWALIGIILSVVTFLGAQNGGGNNGGQQ